MKTKILVSLAMAVMFIGGYLLGCHQASQMWDKYTEKYFIYMPASTHAMEDVRLLTELREGHQEDAMGLMEIMLNGELITFMGYDKIPKEDFVVHAIQRARDYRTKYPWTDPFTNSPSPSDVEVQKILASVK
jgi:hypothetical protein